MRETTSKRLVVHYDEKSLDNNAQEPYLALINEINSKLQNVTVVDHYEGAGLVVIEVNKGFDESELTAISGVLSVQTDFQFSLE